MASNPLPGAEVSNLAGIRLPAVREPATRSRCSVVVARCQSLLRVLLSQRASTAVLATVCLLVFACAHPSPKTVPATSASSGAACQSETPLFSAETAIQDGWKEVAIRGRTRFRIRQVGGRLAIEAQPNRSASGLARWIDADTADCRWLEWSWRVDELQASADLGSKSGDDVGAALFLLFGDPGYLTDPDPVPTLRYVWTTDRHPVESIIPNPHLPDTVRNVVVRSGDAALGRWSQERRDLVADYTAAFGTSPPEPLSAMVLFVDNDQTREPSLASFESARLLCSCRP